MMMKCTLLLPNSDNDERSLASSQDRILSQLFDLFGGYTIESTDVQGMYKMPNGTWASDESTRVIICVENARAGEFERLLPGFAKELRQESLYYEKSFPCIEFVKAEKENSSTNEVCKGSKAGQKKHFGQLDRAELPPALGEFCEAFDGRTNSGMLDYANILKATVDGSGGAEVQGELPREVVVLLWTWGCESRVYKHHGVTVTVVRPIKR